MTHRPPEAAAEPCAPRVERDEDGRPVFVHDCADRHARRTTLPLSHDRGWWWQDGDTLMPSIHCSRCDTHGWWRQGRWEGV
jgi:hypothetical protein